MKIAILTFHRAYNSGAMLQAYALKVVLERMGHIVEFPSCNHVGESPRFLTLGWNGTLLKTLRSWLGRSLWNIFSLGYVDLPRYKLNSFRRKYLPERDCVPSDFEELYDCIVVGSDQVWNPNCIGEKDAPLFLLESFSFSKPIIAYSVSCGDFQFDQNTLTRISMAATKYTAISVREQVVNKFLGSSFEVVPDPTLLLDYSNYKFLIKPLKKKRRKILYYFTLESSRHLFSTVRELARRLDAECIITLAHLSSRFLSSNNLNYDYSPSRMLSEMARADYIVATSFHGTVFAISSNKPFLSLRSKVDKYESRPASLLRQLDMSERLVDTRNTLDEMESLLRKPMSLKTSDHLSSLRNDGLKFLRDKLHV